MEEILDEHSIGGLRQDLILIPTSAWILGFVSGLSTSSRLSGRQYLAENAHRLPTTVQGWYFYQKTKNYRVMYGGVLGGLKTGTRLGIWTTVFVGLQEGIEIGLRKSIPITISEKGEVLEGGAGGGRGLRTRWISGSLAGLTLAGIAGRIYRLSRHGGMRRIFLGTTLGAVAGGVHDLRDWLKVNRPTSS